MFFLGDSDIQFRRRKGSKNKYKKINRKEAEQRRAEINNTRKVVGTGVDIAKETRGWLNLLRSFR
jgi:hypothetical protein